MLFIVGSASFPLIIYIGNNIENTQPLKKFKMDFFKKKLN